MSELKVANSVAAQYRKPATRRAAARTACLNWLSIPGTEGGTIGSRKLRAPQRPADHRPLSDSGTDW